MEEGLDVAIKWETEVKFQYRTKLLRSSFFVLTPLTASPKSVPLPPVSVRRTLKSVGQERGTVGIEITNNEEDGVLVIWTEIWPWWLRAFVGTLSERRMDASSSSQFFFSFSSRAI